MRSSELQTNLMYAERPLQCGAETYSPRKNILNSDVTFVFMSSFVREYPGRGYVQENMIYIQRWYIGTFNDRIIASRLLWNCIVAIAVEL